MSGSNDPPELSVSQAVEKFINRRRPNWKGETERTYRKSLDTFIQYTDDEEIETISDFSRFLLGGYTDWLLNHELEDGSNYAKVTIVSKQKQARRWIKWMEAQGLVMRGLHLSIETLKLEDHEYSRDDSPDPSRIRELLAIYRNSTKWRGTRRHALLEVIAHVGARRIGIRALDLGDGTLKNALSLSETEQTKGRD